jgi:putative DNA methylase
LAPDELQLSVLGHIKATWKPEALLSTHPQYMGVPRYGLTSFSDLFTERQLVVITTLCDLVQETQKKAIADAIQYGGLPEGDSLNNGGTGARALGEAIGVYLAFTVNRSVDRGSLCGIAVLKWRYLEIPLLDRQYK